MANQKNGESPWRSMIPAWGSMITAIPAMIAISVIAYIGYTTLPTIVEDLKLKEEVKVLYIERRDLVADVSNLKEALADVEGTHDRAVEELARQDKMLADTRSDITAARADLTAQRDEVKELRSETRELRDRNDRIVDRFLKREDESRQDVKAIKNLRAEAEKRLVEARYGQRVFVLETLATKVKARTPLVALGSFSGLTIRTMGKLKIFGIQALTAGRLVEHFTLAHEYTGLKSPDAPTGRAVVERLFGAREWDLLKEDDRRRLQKEVRDFMDGEATVFDAKVDFDREIYGTFISVQFRLFKRRSAQEKGTDVAVEPNEPDRVPTAKDVAKAASDFKDVKEAYEREGQRVGDAIKALHDAVGRMVQKLSPATG